MSSPNLSPSSPLFPLCPVCLCRWEAIPLQLGRLRLEVRPLWRTHTPLPQTHRPPSVPVSPVWAGVLPLRPPGSAHEATHVRMLTQDLRPEEIKKQTKDFCDDETLHQSILWEGTLCCNICVYLIALVMFCNCETTLTIKERKTTKKPQHAISSHDRNSFILFGQNIWDRFVAGTTVKPYCVFQSTAHQAGPFKHSALKQLEADNLLKSIDLNRKQ